jgi:hypothetical protein
VNVSLPLRSGCFAVENTIYPQIAVECNYAARCKLAWQASRGSRRNEWEWWEMVRGPSKQHYQER